MKKLTRRQFATSVVAAAAMGSAASPSSAFAQTPNSASKPDQPSFAPDFVWGCATSAYQIEGAAAVDGRGPSIWDTFSHTPGKVFQGDTGDVADDSYHLYKEDVKLLRNLGATGYRFSVSWPRVFPNGTGKPNEKGLAYYDRLVDELLANNIAPFITLYHWDLPQALPGGWQSRDTAKALGDYAGFVVGRLSDRVKHFFTTNEFVCISDVGHRLGLFAPGLTLSAAEANQVRHNVVLGHGLAVQAIRANARRGTLIGLAENAVVYVPAIETPENIEAAHRATRNGNAPFLTAVMEGRYLDSYLENEGADAPKVAEGDMRIIGSPLDFVGLNVYQPQYVRADGSAQGYAVQRQPASYPHMASPWLFLGPEAIYWAIRNVGEIWKPAALFITENGCSSDDVPTADGRVEDTDRVMFLRNYLTHLQRAAAEGYPIKGYFLWSLMDNFEFPDGYGKRFGIHYVDFKTQKRTPKLSAEWYREAIRRNRAV